MKRVQVMEVYRTAGCTVALTGRGGDISDYLAERIMRAFDRYPGQQDVNFSVYQSIKASVSCRESRYMRPLGKAQVRGDFSQRKVMLG